MFSRLATTICGSFPTYWKTSVSSNRLNRGTHTNTRGLKRIPNSAMKIKMKITKRKKTKIKRKTKILQRMTVMTRKSADPPTSFPTNPNPNWNLVMTTATTKYWTENPSPPTINAPITPFLFAFL
uniref:Uncharacterized protein n=1 Tax=Ciona savignyi TaxID=51511 RepID=H2ZEH8_CIOSA